MNLEALIASARAQGASDLHLEPGLPAAVRIRGALKTTGEPVPPSALLEAARGVIGAEQWPRFLERRSFDLSRNYAGTRCRINILQTARGVGFAVRLLAAFTATIEKLNLHPDLKRFAALQNGLVLLSGPTGCGKSSTMAALLQEINLTEARHVVTVESPIEYTFRPRLAYIRQREVGRDTPSFEQALVDALREDPDVLMVGEMREPEVMRLTLNASETGHLVFATVHSSSAVEALQRVANAFPSDMQNAVRAQLADCLAGVLCQRLRYRPDLKIRVPELEILVPNYAAKNFIRQGEFFRVATVMETGADHGCWTLARYQAWMEQRKHWHIPDDTEQAETDLLESALPPALLAGGLKPEETRPSARRERAAPEPGTSRLAREPVPASPAQPAAHRIEIEPVAGGLDEVIKKLEGP